MKITLIAGARPNFMKIAPIIGAIQQSGKNGTNLAYRLVHTGQHYDRNMSGNFFSELNIPEPDINLECGGGSQAEQTASIMVRFEKELLEYPADLVLVVGDVTSTLACSIVSKKLHVPVAHVEGGIRSDDMNMPEEINRIVTDSITDYFFTTSEIANQNLRKTGVSDERIFFVGNTMIDTLREQQKNFKKPLIWDKLQLREKGYIVLTLHRPSNVDDENNLRRIIMEIVGNSRELPIIFPVHPRTSRSLKKIGAEVPNLYLVDPLGYLEFNYLVERSKAVITDSGGITEETTVMGIPCITLRDSTERPETVTIGTNELIGTNPDNVKPVLDRLFEKEWKKGGIPKLWDGKAAERIVENIIKIYG